MTKPILSVELLESTKVESNKVMLYLRKSPDVPPIVQLPLKERPKPGLWNELGFKDLERFKETFGEVSISLLLL